MIALLWRNATCKCKFTIISTNRLTSTTQNDYLSPGFTLHFVFRQSKATDPYILKCNKQFNDSNYFCGYSENIVNVHMATLPGPMLKNKRGRESFSLRLIVHLSNFENHFFNHNYFISSDTYIFQYCYLYQHFHVNDYAFPYCRHYTSTLCSSFFIFHKKDIKFN